MESNAVDIVAGKFREDRSIAVQKGRKSKRELALKQKFSMRSRILSYVQ